LLTVVWEHSAESLYSVMGNVPVTDGDAVSLTYVISHHAAYS